MQTFGSQDIYSVQKCGLLGEGSLASLSELYLPLIGAKALGLYFALYAESGKENDVHFGDELRKKTGMTFSDIQASRRPLEAIGLLQTFYEKGANDCGIFYFRLFAPSSPRAFFGDVLLSGTLCFVLGEEEYKKIKLRYVASPIPECCKDISENFDSFFHPNYNNPIYFSSYFNAVGDGPNKLKTLFDPSKFFEVIKKGGYQTEALFSKDELEFCEKVVSLYGYTTETLATFVVDCIDSYAKFGSKLDRQKLMTKCRNAMNVTYLHRQFEGQGPKGTSYLAKKIHIMDELPPAKWLSLKQNNHTPSKSDLKILETLTYDMGLSSSACNAVVDYVLHVNNNILSRPLCEKIGAGVVRANVISAQDTMEYLNSIIREKRSEALKYNKSGVPSEEPVTTKNDTDEISDEDIDKLFRKALKK